MQKRISPLLHKLRHGWANRCVSQAVLSSRRIIVVRGRGKCSRRRNRSRPKTTCFGRHSPLPSARFISFRKKKKFYFPFRASRKTRECFQTRRRELFWATRDVPAAFETCQNSISEVRAVLFGSLSFYKVLNSTLEPDRPNIFEITLKLRGIQCVCFQTPLISRRATTGFLSDIVRFPQAIQFFLQLHTENAAYTYSETMRPFFRIEKLIV